MRMAAAATALGLTLLAAGTLAACSPDDPVAPPGPAPSRTPVFASDEEALAAAEDAYAGYLDVTNAVAKSGWTETAQLAAVSRDSALEGELASAKEYSAKGFRQVGDIVFDTVTLQQVRDNGGSVLITVYLCLDVTEVDVLDSSGESVVSSGRPDRQALEVDLDNVEEALKVSRSDAWSGASFC